MFCFVFFNFLFFFSAKKTADFDFVNLLFFSALEPQYIFISSPWHFLQWLAGGNIHTVWCCSVSSLSLSPSPSLSLSFFLSWNMTHCFLWPFYLKQLFTLTFYRSHVPSTVAWERMVCDQQKGKGKEQNCHYFRHVSLQEEKRALSTHTHTHARTCTHTHTTPTLPPQKMCCLTHWV